MSKQNTNITELDFISLAEIAGDTPYSQEYLSLRARQGKLRAVKIKRTWMTRKEWVEAYIEEKSWHSKKSVYKEMAPVEEVKAATVVQDVPTPDKPAEEQPAAPVPEEAPVQIPQPPTQDDSVAEKLGAVFGHLKEGMVPKVLGSVMVTSLVFAMVIMTAFTISWGLNGAPAPTDSGIASIPSKVMDTFVFAVQDARIEWDKSIERIEAKKIIAQENEYRITERGQVAGIRIEAEDETFAPSTLETFSGQIDIFVSHVVDTIRLDSGGE